MVERLGEVYLATELTAPGGGLGKGVQTSNARGDVGRIDQFFFSFIEELRKFTVRDIRYFFATHPRVPDRFRWLGKNDPNVPLNGYFGETDPSSKIQISGPYSDAERIYPEVIVEKIGANINDLWLGQKMGQLVIYDPPDPTTGAQNYREVGERRGGKFTSNISLRVAAVGQGPQDLDQVCDLLAYGFVVPIRQRMEKRGQIWIPNSATVSQDIVEDYTNTEKRFVRNIGFQTLSEWYDDFLFDGVSFDGHFTLFESKSQNIIAPASFPNDT